MPALSNDAKVHVVTSLASFISPSDVVKSLKLQFGIDASLQQVDAYDPDTQRGSRLSEKFKQLFHATRERYVDNVADVPIANKGYRLRALDRMLRKAETQGNMALAAQLLEQAAKDAGGAFTNRRELTGAGGGPVESKTTVVDEKAVRAAADELRNDY